MLIKKYGDLMTGIFFAVLGCAGLIMAYHFSDPVIKVNQAIDSKFLPKMICILMITFAVMLIISSTVKLWFRAEKGEEGQAGRESKEAEAAPEYNRVAVSFLAFCIYVLLMDRIGFLLMTIVYLPIQIYAIAPEEKQDRRHMVSYLLIGAASSVIIYLSFVYGFKIMLPSGIL